MGHMWIEYSDIKKCPFISSSPGKGEPQAQLVGQLVLLASWSHLSLERAPLRVVIGCSRKTVVALTFSSDDLFSWTLCFPFSCSFMGNGCSESQSI